MGNIKGSFIKQQIQNLNQIKQQSQTQEVSKKVETTIGQTEFQARKAMFEKEAPKESNLSEETVKHLESRLEQVTSQDLSNKSSLLRPSSLTKQLEQETQEVESSADEADHTTNSRPQVSPPVTQVNQNQVEDLDELDENESENIADNANSTHKPLMPLHPHVNESEENEQEHDESNQVNLKPSIVPGSELDESEGQTSTVNRPTHANQLPVNQLETESKEVEDIADNANSTIPSRRMSDET